MSVKIDFKLLDAQMRMSREDEKIIRADERRKFAEWLWAYYDIYKVYNSEKPSIDELIKRYEQTKGYVK